CRPPPPPPQATPAPASARSLLPEAAPAPPLRRSSGAPSTPFAPPTLDKTLPGTGPPRFTPTAGRDPMATIPLDRDPGPAPAGATEAAGAPRSTRAEATSRRGLWALAALLIGAALALLLFSMRTKEPGVLVVSITDPDGAAVPELEVLVDDQLRCR